MNIEEFIAEHKMTFLESDNDSPSFWGGVGSANSQKFELFMYSDENGLLPEHIEIYQNFINSFNSFDSNIQNRCRTLIPVEKQKTFEDTPITLLFVSIFSPETNNEIDMIWGVRKGWFLFTKIIDFFVQIKDNKIINAELN